MTKIALELTGGLGKNIAFTAVLPYLDSKPTILCSFPVAFENSPYVEECVPWPSSNFRVLSEFDIRKVEPYYVADYRQGKITLIEAIFRSCDVKLVQGAAPKLYLTDKEKKDARAYLDRKGRPVILFQPFGASTDVSSPLSSGQRSLSKDQALKLARFLSDFGTVLVLRGLSQPSLPGFEHPDLNLRFSISLVSEADALVGVDSWLCHAGAALGKRGFFIFTSTDPRQLSYPLHISVQSPNRCDLYPCRRPWPGVPDNFVCPFGLKCQDFNPEVFFEEIESYLKEALVEV
ncbi:hypothetical protein J7J18_06955 [bacterium]|nr:hypothetical protein [bacterium]